jgi:dihydroorotate dehydrogenase
LLTRLNVARDMQDLRPPMLLKIAPDLRDDEMEDIAIACGNGAVDGIIVSNTTLGRDGLRSALKAEPGGLSGLPLLQLSTVQLAAPYADEGAILVAQHSLTSALGKSGRASLVQLYSALVYKGPRLVGSLTAGWALSQGTTLAHLCGCDAEAIAHHGLKGK